MKRRCQIAAKMLLSLRIMYRRPLCPFILALILLPAGPASAALPDGFAGRDIGDEGLPGSADLSGNVMTNALQEPCSEASNPVPAYPLIPYVSVIAENPYPPDRSVYLPFDVTLTWDAGIDQSTDTYYTTQHVYLGNDPNAVAAATTASPEYMGAPTGPNEYGPVSLGGSEFVYWRIDGVSAGTGTVPYPGPVWRFESVCCVCPPWEAGLNLRLKFEDNAFDSSGQGNDGIEIGGPTYVPGMDGQAIHLDGIDDYVRFEYAIGISGGDPRTIAAWVKADTTALAPWTNVFGFTGPGADGTHFDIQVVGDTNSTTTGYYGLNLHGEQYDIMPLDLEWHHLAATFDGTTAYLYADAVLVSFADPALTIDTNDNVHIGKRDDNDNYFPGSIDDVRIYHIAKNEPQIVHIMMIDLWWDWWSLYPSNGAVDVPPGWTTLSWQPGACAADVNGSVVYYSEDLADVTDRTAPSDAVTGSHFTLPMPLDLGQTFYWAVDAVNGPCTWPGEVWTFSTSNWLSVDDMEIYNPWLMPPYIYLTWMDGFGDCTAGSGNNTGAVVDKWWDPVFGGLQSMKYEFDNDGTVYSPCALEQVSGHLMYSRIEAQIADLPSGLSSDWTAAGVRALSIPFHGRAGNATTEPFWVQLRDGDKGYGEKVFYGTYAGESLEDFNDPNWHEWNIDLAQFNVDLNDVVSIVIGIGNEDETGDHGSGTLYLDDIRLYIPRCVPNRSSPAFAALDYAPEANRDCKIDYKELAIMARDWLQTEKTLDPPPKTSPANIINPEPQKNLIVNFNDYAELLNSWLETEIWPF